MTYLTPAQVAKELNVSRRTVQRYLQTGELKHLDLGYKTKRITREALDQFKAARESSACK